MQGETKVGLGILGSGLVLGVAGDVLLRETPYGINVLLWTVALLAALFALARWRRPLLLGARRFMLVPLLASALLFCWRDSSALALLNGVALVGSAGLCAASVHGFRLRSVAPSTVVRAWGGFARSVAEGPVQAAAADVSWSELRLRTHARPLGAAVRGLALAAPLLLLFGVLLVSADAVFGELVGAAVPDVADPLAHVLAILCFGWLAAGALRALLHRPAEGPSRRPRTPGGLGAAEVVVVLALLDVLFLAFVAVQLRTFFGGDAFVQGELGLTYAEYAREGFFQLVAATALAVPLLLAAEWAVRGRGVRAVRSSRALSLVLVALLLVVVASALQRLRLYQREFGLTESRVLATAAVLWLAVVLAWLAVTVLSARRERFAAGALATAFVALLALNALNPDDLIARTNLARAAEGREVDVRHLAGLGGDAAPTLVDALPRLDRVDASILAHALLERAGPDDWRSWNAGRARADELVRAREAELRAFAAG